MSEKRRSRNVLLLLLALLVTVQCSSNRKVSSILNTHLEPPPPPDETITTTSLAGDQPGRTLFLRQVALKRGYDPIALVSFTDLPSHFPEPPAPSPLDEIAEVNLYTLEVDPKLADLVGEDLRNTRFDIPVVVNEEVLKFLNYYQQSSRGVMEDGLRRSGKYLPLFREIFQQEGVPLDLIYMAHVESLFKTSAYSRAKAKGIWQFIRETALDFNLRVDWWRDERSDFVKSTHAAARYLKLLNEQFGDWHLAMAAYNAGPARVAGILEHYGEMDYWSMVKRGLLPRETRNFVPSILASIIIYRHPERYGFLIEPEPPVAFEEVAVDFQVDLRVIADAIAVPVGVVTDLNPELQRGITPFSSEAEDHYLKVPQGTGELLRQRLAHLPPEKRLQFEHHQVAKGETLSAIASRYKVPLQAIAETNRLQNIHRLHIGQDLIIPLAGSVSPAVGNSMQLSDRHVVRQGDSLYDIARSYGLPLNNLLQWNNLGVNDIIHPGQELLLSTGESRR